MAKTTKPTSRINVDVGGELHRQLKIRAAETGRSISEIIRDAALGQMPDGLFRDMCREAGGARGAYMVLAMPCEPVPGTAALPVPGAAVLPCAWLAQDEIDGYPCPGEGRAGREYVRQCVAAYDPARELLFIFDAPDGMTGVRVPLPGCAATVEGENA